jgi:hypothetical protein
MGLDESLGRIISIHEAVKALQNMPENGKFTLIVNYLIDEDNETTTTYYSGDSLKEILWRSTKHQAHVVNYITNMSEQL